MGANIEKSITSDGNCFFRAISYYFHENEDFHYIIREDICNYLKLNASNFVELNFQIELMFVTSKEYIEKVKEDGF